LTSYLVGRNSLPLLKEPPCLAFGPKSVAVRVPPQPPQVYPGNDPLRNFSLLVGLHQPNAAGSQQGWQ